MSTWEEFRKRCADNVQRIRDTSDDGVYAKLYAADVGRLLSMLETIDAWDERPGSDAECAFDATPDGRPQRSAYPEEK